ENHGPTWRGGRNTHVAEKIVLEGGDPASFVESDLEMVDLLAASDQQAFVPPFHPLDGMPGQPSQQANKGLFRMAVHLQPEGTGKVRDNDADAVLRHAQSPRQNVAQGMRVLRSGVDSEALVESVEDGHIGASLDGLRGIALDSERILDDVVGRAE